MTLLKVAILHLLLNLAAQAAEWTYTGATGADHWPELFETCAQSHQSPINIYEGDITIDKQLPPFTFSNYDTPVDLVLSNNGHSAVIALGGSVPVTVSGGGLVDTYRAVQFHFHWGATSADGSEHFISSTAYPMEAHIVHYNTKYTDIGAAMAYPDGLSVLGFMFELSDTNNTNYNEIVRNLASVVASGSTVYLTPASLKSFLPPAFSNFYRYPGSLTTPACDESVTWTVFKETVKISEKQLAAFRTLIDSHTEELLENHRSVQPLNDRIVTANFDPHVHWSYHNADEWKGTYEACGSDSQSPINIVTGLTNPEENLLQFTFINYDGSSPVGLNLKNTGHAAQIDFSGSEVAVSEGGLPETYVASQMHFHWGSVDRIGSEHLIDDVSYPMELHIVHYRKSLGSVSAAAVEFQGLAVLGFFFEISSNDNPALNSIIQNLPNIQSPDSSVTIPTFSLNDILPTNKLDFYRYDGSLTTPRCLQSVIWTVFKDTIKISSAQMAVFRSLKLAEKDDQGVNLPMVDITRPVQPLNGRVVLRNFNFLPPDNHWSYDGSHGPDSWYKSYPLCQSVLASRQSPVDIRTFYVQPTYYQSLRLDGYDTTSAVTMDMKNTGHTVQIDIGGNLRMSRGGLTGVYKAVQVHFHWGSDSSLGSEHTVNGKSYPMEIHFVHYNTKFPDFSTASTEANGLAVLAVLVEISSTPNTELNFLFDALSKVSQPDTKVHLDPIATFPFIPANRTDFYRYEGSLTTPGCYETVSWTIFKSTLKISEVQINKLRSLQRLDYSTNLPTPMVDNNRPVQPLNGRLIRSRF
ncbi:Carbonic anhydrase 14 [Bulinus truncatus]|nr:Carbonic anhydrase 14 [Bulinus truncatus]